MKSLNEDIKNGQWKPVYLLYGEEAYLKKHYKDRMTKAILPDAPISAESKLLEKLSGLYTEISEKTEALAEAEKAAESMEDNIEKVAYFHYTILAKMDDLRSSVDTAEALIPDSFLPYPTYDELLFSV